MAIEDSDLENWFSYHAPLGDQTERYARLRAAAHEFAKVIIGNTPACADQTATIRMLRKTMMMANATIACNEADFGGHLI